jgi:hypothetical protein
MTKIKQLLLRTVEKYNLKHIDSLSGTVALFSGTEVMGLMVL